MYNYIHIYMYLYIHVHTHILCPSKSLYFGHVRVHPPIDHPSNHSIDQPCEIGSCLHHPKLGMHVVLGRGYKVTKCCLGRVYEKIGILMYIATLGDGNPQISTCVQHPFIYFSRRPMKYDG